MDSPSPHFFSTFYRPFFSSSCTATNTIRDDGAMHNIMNDDKSFTLFVPTTIIITHNRDAANDLDDELLDTSLSPDEIRDLEAKRARDMRERALRAEVLSHLCSCM